MRIPTLRRTLMRAAAVFALAATSALFSAPAPRSAPSRPASAVPTTTIAGIAYVSAPDIAAQLGLTLSWIEAGVKLALTGSSLRAEIERDTRDIRVNGVRVFLGDPVVVSRGQLHVSKLDFERCLTPMLRPGHGVAVPAAPTVIVLDPGHGGRDNGTSAHEKTYALDVAKRAKKALEAAGYRVRLTREDDRYLTLAQRSAFAVAEKASLFVSIHFNALANDTKTGGFEIYTFPPATQRSTQAWSLRVANDAEPAPSPGNRFDHWNVALAHAIHRRFIGDLAPFDRGKKLMHLGVLRGLQCPGVLVECGFLTSHAEARKIATPDYRQKLAETLASGIRDYAATLQHARTRVASAR